MDPKSELADFQTDFPPRFVEDKTAQQALAIRDGLIFTGQNPASSAVVAEKLLDYLA